MLIERRLWLPAVAVGTVIFAICVGCNRSVPSHDEVQRQAEQTTAAVKQDAQQAAAATRQAAGEAVDSVNAVAAGVKSGIKSNAPDAGDSKANLNTSTQVRLAMLPGISYSKAGEIIDKRPYTSSRQLVSRGVLTPEEFAGIAQDVEVRSGQR